MCTLPTWVPGWTMQTCEEAIDFASPEFSRCLLGNPFKATNDICMSVVTQILMCLLALKNRGYVRPIASPG
jgi:hypothetical protein